MPAKTYLIFSSKHFATGVAQSILWLLTGLVLATSVPHFENIFRDFGTKLPSATQIVLFVGHLLALYWYFGFLPLLIWPFIYYQIATWLSRKDGAPDWGLWCWKIASWLLPFILIVIGTIAIFRPLVVLITPMSSGGK